MTDTIPQLSPLRRRMIEDMTVRNLLPATQRSYIHAVAKFSRYFGRSQDRLGVEDVRAYQVYLVARGISWPALNQTVCALRFFYGVTLGRNEIPEWIAYPIDRKAYRRRIFIERLFCKLKNWRRIATRYDRHAQNFLSGLALAALIIEWI